MHTVSSSPGTRFFQSANLLSDIGQLKSGTRKRSCTQFSNLFSVWTKWNLDCLTIHFSDDSRDNSSERDKPRVLSV